jgi:hypothetical protein
MLLESLRCVIMTFLCNNLIDKREKVKPGELFTKMVLNRKRCFVLRVVLSDTLPFRVTSRGTHLIHRHHENSSSSSGLTKFLKKITATRN